MNSTGSRTIRWNQARKVLFQQWVKAKSHYCQLELFAWKQPISITTGAEEFIWKDGQLYKAVRPLDQLPWMYPQPVLPVTPQPSRNGDVFIGDIPGWYTITWCSNSTEIKTLDKNNQFIYLQ